MYILSRCLSIGVFLNVVGGWFVIGYLGYEIMVQGILVEMFSGELCGGVVFGGQGVVVVGCGFQSVGEVDWVIWGYGKIIFVFFDY